MRVDNPTAAPCDVQTFLGIHDSWIKPEGAVSVNIALIGGGGAGSSGSVGSLGTRIPGGAGGSGAGWLNLTVPASLLPDSSPVSAGVGGSSVGRGADPTPTTFGNLFSAAGGVNAVPDDDTNPGAVVSGAMIQGCNGAAGVTATFPFGAVAPITAGGCPGGSSGGGISAAGERGQGIGGRVSTSTGGSMGSNGGVADGESGEAGPNAPTGMPLPGTAGASGAASLLGNGGAGGAGGLYGAAGSGGGAALTPHNGGLGGDGGPGNAVITTYF